MIAKAHLFEFKSDGVHWGLGVRVLVALLAPLIVIVVSSFALVFRQRRPEGMRSSIEGFQQQMKALSPENDVEPKA